MSARFWETNKEFPTFVLQEALIAYHEKASLNIPVFVDIGDVSISADEDYVELFTSLVLSAYNDGVEKVTIDGVVSKYTETSTIGTMNDKKIRAVAYRKVHEKSFINKELKDKMNLFINNNVDFEADNSRKAHMLDV